MTLALTPRQLNSVQSKAAMMAVPSLGRDQMTWPDSINDQVRLDPSRPPKSEEW